MDPPPKPDSSNSSNTTAIAASQPSARQRSASRLDSDGDILPSNTTIYPSPALSTATFSPPLSTAAFSPAQTPTTAPYSRASIDVVSGHGRSMSAADAARRAKRFSMTFPINATAIDASNTPSPTRAAAPTHPGHPSLPLSLPEGLASPSGPSDSGFLTAIAAQERRVLELREELNKAEVEMKRLKQEYSWHEAQRKRHDVRRLQKLQPLHTSNNVPARNSSEDDPDGSSAWLQQEMERRKALLSGTKQSNRTVFSGSRHARTLSLLSPTIPSAKPAVLRESRLRSRSPTAPERPAQPLRLPTDDVLTTEVAETADTNIDLGLPRDVLMKTGKQMANDFRDGLWTFIEDLRQATVGDEGVNGTTTRTQGLNHPSVDQRGLKQQPSRGSLKPSARPQPIKRSSTTGSRRSLGRSPARSSVVDDSALLDLGGSFWRENGVEEGKVEERPVTKKAHKKKLDPSKREHHAKKASLDGWDTWDSPERESKAGRPSSETSISDVQTSPSPDGTSPRTSFSSYREGTQGPPSQPERLKRDSLPWPAISKLSPSNLRRTASNLMADWEKSLTPPPEESGKQSDYMGRAASPVASLASSLKDGKAD